MLTDKRLKLNIIMNIFIPYHRMIYNRLYFGQGRILFLEYNNSKRICATLYQTEFRKVSNPDRIWSEMFKRKIIL